MRLFMRKIVLILIAIILCGYCLSYAAEPPAAPVSQKESEPSKENKKDPDNNLPERNPLNISDNFVIDSNWIAVDLGAFEPHAINNSTQIAGDIIADKGGPFAGVWKQGFVEKLDGTVVTVRSSAVAINESGQVVGYQKGRYGDNTDRAVLWNNGFMQELGALGGIESRALAINNSGDVVGWVRTNYGAKDAFIWRTGTMEYLGVLTSGIAINSNGQILGTIDGGNPVLWNKGIMQKLEPPGDQEFTPVGAQQQLKVKTVDGKKPVIEPDERIPLKLILTPICLNDAGQVAGRVNNGIAFLWNNGELQYMDFNEHGRFIPLGMNKYGMLAGRIDSKAVVWNKGNVTELNNYFKGLRRWRFTEARGINDNGQIIVYASDGLAGKSQAFLVTPRRNIPILITGSEYIEFERETTRTRKTIRPLPTGK